MLSFDQFEVLTFDCYGTLIDWESGIVSALKPLLSKKGKQLDDEEILERYAQFEPTFQQGEFQTYKTILKQIMRKFADAVQCSLERDESMTLVESLKNWQPFPDSIAALKTLKQKYKLAIISNIDDDLFRYSNNYLQIPFDWIITSEQVRSYKPSQNNFTQAIQRIDIKKEKILHIAQSLFHDIQPAKKMGLSTVWVNRRHHKTGSGATPKTAATPDLEVPDLRTLVDHLI